METQRACGKRHIIIKHGTLHALGQTHTHSQRHVHTNWQTQEEVGWRAPQMLPPDVLSKVLCHPNKRLIIWTNVFCVHSPPLALLLSPKEAAVRHRLIHSFSLPLSLAFFLIFSFFCPPAARLRLSGGFSETYSALCDYNGISCKEEVQWVRAVGLCLCRCECL